MATTISAADALGHLPPGLRGELLTAYNAIVTNYRMCRWEPSELNGGKFCEVVYTILRGHVDGSFPARASKPSNMVDACRELEKATGTRSVRIQIPRMLLALYEIRNNRGVGHVGGDVDANHMDAANVVATARWILAELVRVFHNLDAVAATAVVEALTERDVPVIWEVGDRKRVLNTGLSRKDKTLLLLYATPGAAAESDLVSWMEQRYPASYRKDVLRPLHDAKLVEHDRQARTVQLSPLGSRYVEENLQLAVP